MLPSDLNDALQRRLREYKLSFESLRQMPSVIRYYLSGQSSREITITRLEQILRSHVTDIPRKGARGGYDYIGTPDSRLHFLIEDVMAILDSAKFEPVNNP